VVARAERSGAFGGKRSSQPEMSQLRGKEEINFHPRG